MSDPLVDALLFKMSRPASELIRKRIVVIAFWKNRALELASAERELHAEMCPEVERVMASKRLLLYGEMFEAIAFPSRCTLLGHMVSGFDLCGSFPSTGVLPYKERAATTTLEDL